PSLGQRGNQGYITAVQTPTEVGTLNACRLSSSSLVNVTGCDSPGCSDSFMNFTNPASSFTIVLDANPGFVFTTLFSGGLNGWRNSRGLHGSLSKKGIRSSGDGERRRHATSDAGLDRL